jgi:hypothetical protein
MGLLNDIDSYYKNHLSTLSKKTQKKEIQFIKATVKLYFKIDDILNLIDIMHIAFLLRKSEYDIYTDRIIQNLNNPMFNKVKRLKKYIIENIAAMGVCEGVCVDLDRLGYWGDPLNSEYIPTLTRHNNSSEESNDKTSADWIEAPRKRKKKKIRLEDRIQWGAERMHFLIKKYKRKYSNIFD